MSEEVQNHDGAYAKGTPLVELFGDGARARLLSVFASKPSREFTITELAEQAGTTRKTVYEHIESFEELGVIGVVGTGRTKRYTASDSQIATKLYELNGVMLKKLLDEV